MSRWTPRAAPTAAASGPSHRRRCAPRTSRCFLGGSTHPAGRRPSRALCLQGRPQPLLKVEFRIEDLPHEEDDLALRVESVSAAIVPEAGEDLSVHPDVELDLLRTPRRRGPRHAFRIGAGILQDFYKSIQIVSSGSIRSN